MSGVRLRELDASDTIDVLHYLFEEDIYNVYSGEHAEAKDKTRQNIYGEMYNIEYKYAVGKSSSSSNNFDGLDDPLGDDGSAPTPVDPFAKSNAVKPYTPATDFDPEVQRPFGAILDAPLR